MRKVYKLFLLLMAACWISTHALAQIIPTPLDNQGKPASINVNLENIFNQKVPRKYKVANVTVTGNQYFDAALLTSPTFGVRSSPWLLVIPLKTNEDKRGLSVTEISIKILVPSSLVI